MELNRSGDLGNLGTIFLGIMYNDPGYMSSNGCSMHFYSLIEARRAAIAVKSEPSIYRLSAGIS